MTNTICLDETYSTTRRLAKEKPIIENKPEDKFETILFLPEGKDRKGEGGLRTKGYFKKSYEDKLLISIITVVFNGEKYIEETIKSVINQSYDNVEYIIIDGGSNDETLKIIEKYENEIDYWVSEKDAGIYDAMNKGISLAQGEIIGLINADDYYETDVFCDVVNAFQSNKSDVVFGHCIKIEKNGYKKLQKSLPICHKYRFLPCTMFWIWFGMVFNHPSSFIILRKYKEIGLYDINYKIAADYELLLRIYKQHGKFNQLSKNLAYFRVGGISTSTEANMIYKEMKKAWLSNNYIMGLFIIFVKKILKYKNLIFNREKQE